MFCFDALIGNLPVSFPLYFLLFHYYFERFPLLHPPLSVQHFVVPFHHFDHILVATKFIKKTIKYNSKCPKPPVFRRIPPSIGHKIEGNIEGARFWKRHHQWQCPGKMPSIGQHIEGFPTNLAQLNNCGERTKN
jgi:hypothetical protein